MTEGGNDSEAEIRCASESATSVFFVTAISVFKIQIKLYLPVGSRVMHSEQLQQQQQQKKKNTGEKNGRKEQRRVSVHIPAAC